MTRRVVIQRVGVVGCATLVAVCGPSPTATRTTRRHPLGYVFGGSLRTAESEPFREELQLLGHVDGDDIEIRLRAGESLPDRLPGLVSDLLAEPVDVLVTVGTLATLAARDATRTIPIIFHRVTDPVGQRIVESLARPGANVTGVAADTSGPKQLEFLKTTLPGLRRLALLWNANNPGAALQLRATEDAARSFQLDLQTFAVHGFDELDRALDTIAGSLPDALLVGSAFNHARVASQIPDFAAAHALPQMYGTDGGFVRAGGLMALGANAGSLARSAARMVDKVLRGSSPADLPVEMPTQFDFIVNLAAAKRIALTLPDTVLRRATEVIQ